MRAVIVVTPGGPATPVKVEHEGVLYAVIGDQLSDDEVAAQVARLVGEVRDG